MDVNMNVSGALASATGQTGDAVALSVLRKSMEVEAENARALIEAIPSPAQNSTNLPAHLGQNVNTTA